MTNEDYMKTIEELENEKWGDPPLDSYVVKRSHELRTIPLNDLGVEDLRLLVTQQVGLPYVVPIALNILHSNPFAEGDHYEGDLLNAISTIPDAYWNENEEIKKTLFDLETKVQGFMEGAGKALFERVVSLKRGRKDF